MKIMDKSKKIREQIDLIKNLGKLNESKVATDDSPLGYYTTANALMPTDLFKKLDEHNIEYKEDKYRNFIEIFVKDINEANIARELVLDIDTFEAADIDDDDMKYIEEDGVGDMLEIKMK